jgi:hypothetical protein
LLCTPPGVLFDNSALLTGANAEIHISNQMPSEEVLNFASYHKNDGLIRVSQKNISVTA